MSVFTASPYTLAQGALIVGTIQASNSIGISTTSTANTAGVVVAIPPLTPSDITIDSSGTNQSQITVIMPTVTGSNNGGSTILSYSLEWDAGYNNGTFTSLIGYSSYQLSTTYVATGLIEGLTYRFRHRVYNIFGWSGYSSVVSGIAAVVPQQPIAPIVTNVDTSIQVEWIKPYNGGNIITSYTVEFKKSDGTYQAESTYCLGTDATILSSLS